jgi:AraC-like DNA-binding protein
VTDFASAAMMRVLSQGMRELGLNPGDSAPDTGDARVQLLQKQELVRSAVAQGGLACLPLLGRGLHRLTHEPTHHALVSARSARDLFERWQRLERYIHSRHRCIVETCEEGQARIRHVSLTPGDTPSPPEDLVVAGVLAALLEAIGLQRVELRIGAASAVLAADAHGIDTAVAERATCLWHFEWEGVTLNERPSSIESRVRELGADPAWPQTVRTTYLRLLADLARPLSVPELAADLAVPARTLQRRLGHAGLSYSRLLAEARCRTGAWRLINTADPIAEIGFLSGFSDQPHFTREMQRRVGMPPAAYREAFGALDRSR